MRSVRAHTLRHVPWAWVWGLWLVNGARSQATTVRFVPGEPFDVDVRAGGQSLALNLPPMSLNASASLALMAQYAPDVVGPVPSVSIVLLFHNESLAWSLNHQSRSSSKRLCFSDHGPMDTVALVLYSGQDTRIRLNLAALDLALSFDAEVTTEVAMNHPVTFLVDPVPNGTMEDRYLLRVQNLNPESEHICTIVAAYARACPFRDQANTIRNSDMWMTVLSQGAMTMRFEDAQFALPFYVTILVLDSDRDCHLSDHQPNERVLLTSSVRSKGMRISIQRTRGYQSYLQPIFLMVFVTILIGIFGMCIMLGKRFEDLEAAPHANPHPEEGPAPDARSVYHSAKASREDMADTNGLDEDDLLKPVITSPYLSPMGSHRSIHELEPTIPSVHGDRIDGIQPAGEDRPDIDDLKRRCLDSIPANSTRRDRIEKGLERLNENTKLSQMTHILEGDPWFRRNRSRVYCYLVPLLALFYFIPSIQFVFLVKDSESLTGSQDLCYHNYLCSKPWSIFSDFNHVISNLPYMIYGFIFVGLVRFKSAKLPESQNPKNDHKAGKGILQQLSIFYAMGFSLTAQGCFSICYHVCPTNHSLQFDTTMMYVMCMLGCVKIYQFRHPDANANAYSFFYFLGGIVLLEALTLYSYSWWVYSLFLAVYSLMIVFIAVDCYFIGVARLDSKITLVLIKDVFYKSWRTGPSGQRVGIRYPQRFGFAVVFCLINFAHVIYLIVAKVLKPDKSVTHVVLAILAGNLFLYIGYYIFRKNKMLCTAMAKSMRRDGSEDQVDAMYFYPNPVCPRHRIPIFISGGFIFAVLSFICAVLAITFYLDRSANRNLSPAESRNINEDCAYLNFYDSHDTWHFLSASAIFMAFLALLTVDDDQLHVPREDIEVF
eukprot:maker-scaffold487_size158652-snap-gene-0.34 protein:Tk00166 transcript:maker-scaffold487_size158652-snap-gene-0.34-mRNA-1 annotation:"sid1 transmembrane family member 1"